MVHSRNFVALDPQIASVLARVPHRVHGEHGRDMHDLHLANARHLAVRRWMRPVIGHWVALSAQDRPLIKQTNIAHGHQQVNNFPPNERSSASSG